jgi:hypothetical protein
MKALVMLFFVVTFSVPFYPQNVVVPKEVQHSFQEMYPNAEDIKWEQEENMFEAEFLSGGLSMEACFMPDGSFVESETEIPDDELPPFITNYLMENYPGYTIREADKVTDAEANVFYEVEIMVQDTDYEVLFNEDGRFMKVETDDEEND